MGSLVLQNMNKRHDGGRKEIRQHTAMFLRHRVKRYDLGIKKGYFLHFELVLHD